MANQKLQIAVGARIKQLRLKQAKGQTEVAQGLQISVAALSKLESGLTDINLSRLAQIAKYFGVTLISMLGDQQDTPIANVDEVEKLKQQLLDKDAELMKLQQKIIALYEKLVD